MFGTQKRNDGEPQLAPPFLQIKRNGRVISRVLLSQEESVFAGSSATCKVQLFGEQINSFHCLFCFNEGQLMVNNCSNSAVTMVNGNPLEGEAVLEHGNEVVVGETTIVPVLRQDAENVIEDLDAVWNATVATHEVADDVVDEESEEPETATPSSSVGQDIDLENTASEFMESQADAPQAGEPSDAELPLEPLGSPELAAEAGEALTSPQSSLDAADPGDPAGDGWEPPGGDRENAEVEDLDTDGWSVDFGETVQDDTAFHLNDEVQQELELLRSEIEYLRCEIAEKDALLAGQPGSDGDVVVGNNEEEVSRLVNRLEELLAELQSSDDRVSALNDQLRAVEQANEADQEERRQLESWLNEIESRVSQREEEMEGEMQRLRKKWQGEQQQRAKAEQQLKQLMARKPAEADAQHDANAESLLQDRLQQESRATESLRQENDELKEQLQRVQQDDQTQEVRSLQQKLAQMELESSRERAEISRQRVELERVREELQRRAQQEANGEVESRITAMRQHLREIYEEEKTVEMEKRQNSLGGRISRLLGKL